LSARLAERIAELGPWFHDMELDGVRTAPDHFLHGYPRTKFARFAHVLPDDLGGRSVLDIGCNGGFYSLEMKRRGAGRVLGIDADPRYLAQARLAAEVTGLEIELAELSVYDVAALGERFDLVVFMGVFYHLRHPLLALDLIREHVADDLMLFQTLQRGALRAEAAAIDYPFQDASPFENAAWPRMHFIEHRYAGDPTNWWAPNAAASQAMLRSAGFEIVEHPETEVYLCRRAERAYGAEPIYPARPQAPENRP
jgi:tRNA (mo5U34)-methyltransferase